MKLISSIKKLFLVGEKSLGPNELQGTGLSDKDAMDIDQKCCENLDNCPFFKEYKGNLSVKEKWIDIYCRNPSTSQKCERRKTYKSTGQRPPIYMTPSGMMLPDR
ncbi:MAG TPA: hypothetical protein P5260_19605 [Candidatus Competibacter sp.]|nr:hypothetical protein [Candidatus Competibacter sp.]